MSHAGRRLLTTSPSPLRGVGVPPPGGRASWSRRGGTTVMVGFPSVSRSVLWWVEDAPTDQTATHEASGQRLVADRPVCLLYTSDAADDLTRGDLGGRR